MGLAAEQYSPSFNRRQVNNQASVDGTPAATPGPLFDLSEANRALADSSPLEILTKALDASSNPIISTSFSAYSAVLLHMVQNLRPGTPVVWCDTGFNTAATYRFVDQLVRRLDINLKVYHPDVSATHLRVRYDGIPEAGTSKHKLFSNTVKLEPFARAFRELQPDLWINGIRAEETEFRKSQNIFTWDKARSTTKVAPCFHSKTVDLVNYLIEHDLPSEVEYHDPTKPEEHLECGLHNQGAF